MESLIVGVLVLVVLWLVAKQSGRTRERERLEALETVVSRLDARLGLLEKAALAPVERATVAPPLAAAAPEPAPAPPAPVHVRPIQRPNAPFVNRQPPSAAPEPKPAIVETAKEEPAIAPPLAIPSVPPPTVEPVLARMDVPEPFTPKAEASEPKRSISLEERLGHNWLNKLGIVCLVIGLSSFLGYQVRTLGPLGKSMVGLLISLAILGGGLLMERRSKYRVFSRALIGGGWALTYFVTFALYHVDAMRILPSQGIDLVLMLGVAAAMVWHSLHYKSQVVTSLAFLLAFVTVGISQVTLFSLVAGVLLVAGLVFVAARECWFELALAGLVGAYVNHFLWLHRVLPDGGRIGHPFPEFLASAGLIVLYWLIFRLFYVLRVPQNRRQEAVSSLTAILNSVGMLSLLKFQSSHPEWAFWSLLTLGAVEMALAFLARRRWRIGFVVLSSIASVLLLAAIPFRFGGANWSLMWLLMAEILFLVGVRMPEIVFRRLGKIAGFAAFGQLLVTGVAPVFELRQLQTDLSHHWPVAIALLAAAAAFWFNAEFTTRRWEFVANAEVDRVSLRAMSYLAALAVGCGLWICLPSAWTIVAWLGVALALGWAADRLDSRDLATQSDLLAFSAVVRAAGINFFATGHWGWLTLRAATVAPAVVLLYAMMRRKTRAQWLDEDYAVEVYSWLACLLLAALLWFELPAAGIAVGWAVLGLILACAGDWRKARNFATQADLLACAAVVRAASFNLFVTERWHGLSVRAITVGALCVLLYLAMRRRTQAYGAQRNYIPPVYSWAACGLLSTLAWYELQPVSVAVAWGVYGMILFELGMVLRRGYLRHQGYALLGASLIRIFFVNLNVAQGGGWLGPRMYTIVPLIAAYLWVYERLQSEPSESNSTSRVDRFASNAAVWLATAAAAALAYFQVRGEWVSLAWAALALLTLLAGWALRRRVFVEQSLVLLLASAGRALAVNLFSPAPLTTAFVSSRAFSVGAACGLMLLALPVAFGVRRQYAEAASSETGWQRWTIFHPEQPFFFVPLLLTTLLLTLELRAGMITVGWSALGVVVFLLALAVGERSYRLSGLALLMLGVGKVVCVDIWHATPSDRYLTLIVMGAAMLLVSFLYSRYRETILKFL